MRSRLSGIPTRSATSPTTSNCRWLGQGRSAAGWSATALRRAEQATQIAQLRADAPVPLPRLVPVLAAADLIKYADRPVAANKARELAAETRGIVDAVEDAVIHRAKVAAKPEKAA